MKQASIKLRGTPVHKTYSSGRPLTSNRRNWMRLSRLFVHCALRIFIVISWILWKVGRKDQILDSYSKCKFNFKGKFFLKSDFLLSSNITASINYKRLYPFPTVQHHIFANKKINETSYMYMKVYRRSSSYIIGTQKRLTKVFCENMALKKWSETSFEGNSFPTASKLSHDSWLVDASRHWEKTQDVSIEK